MQGIRGLQTNISTERLFWIYSVLLLNVAAEAEVLTFGLAGSTAQLPKNVCCQEFFIFIWVLTLWYFISVDVLTVVLRLNYVV